MRIKKIKELVLVLSKVSFLLLLGLSFSLLSRSQSPLHAFQLNQVRLLPGIFKDAQQTDMNYMLALDPDRLLTTQLTIESVKPGTFNINVRYPGWVDPGKLEVKLNGEKVPVEVQPDSYVKLDRTWKKGDKIEVRIPMKLTTEKLPDSSYYVAFLRGPIVLAAKTETMNPDNCKGDGADQFGGYRAKGKIYPLDSLPVLVSNESHLENYLIPVHGKPQTYTASALIGSAAFKDLELIPFYKLHDARYMIYWPVKSKEEYQQ